MKIQTGLDLDADVISGLVSYCEMASPLDAKEYLDNIIGEEAGKGITEEYLKRRGHSVAAPDSSTSELHAYVKQPSNSGLGNGSKKPLKAPKVVTTSTNHGNQVTADDASGSHNVQKHNVQKRNQGNSRKKKSGKVVSLAEASKGSIIFQQGKPCSCQARRHRLVSNCLSCGKIVCEQEGEGPCNFCGALVLREGSSYAGLNEGDVPLSEAEAVAEAYAKRLVEYDRNSAARTTVIDDQSDYYQIEGNSWLSKEEKELIRKKREEIEEAERAQRSKVVMTFDLVGRKVLMTEEEASQEIQNRILLRPSEEREATRIKPNPNLKMQPVFVDPGPRKPVKENVSKRLASGLCLQVSGRVQHDTNELSHSTATNIVGTTTV